MTTPEEFEQYSQEFLKERGRKVSNPEPNNLEHALTFASTAAERATSATRSFFQSRFRITAALLAGTLTLAIYTSGPKPLPPTEPLPPTDPRAFDNWHRDTYGYASFDTETYGMQPRTFLTQSNRPLWSRIEHNPWGDVAGLGIALIGRESTPERYTIPGNPPAFLYRKTDLNGYQDVLLLGDEKIIVYDSTNDPHPPQREVVLKDGRVYDVRLERNKRGPSIALMGSTFAPERLVITDLLTKQPVFGTPIEGAIFSGDGLIGLILENDLGFVRMINGEPHLYTRDLNGRERELDRNRGSHYGFVIYKD